MASTHSATTATTRSNWISMAMHLPGRVETLIVADRRGATPASLRSRNRGTASDIASAPRTTVVNVDEPLPINELMDAVEATSHSSDERLAALHQLAAHPCSWHRVLATEVWAEISELHRQRREWDQAIAAWEQTIQLGYRSTPHPRAQIAELLVLAGRRDEGDALYAQLLDRFPSDVWLRNSAALTYLDIADWPTALWWIDTALDITMNDDDQVRLIDQLVDMRSRALAALGRSGDDDLGRRVAAFVPSPRSRSAGVGDSWGEVEPSTERCEHCGGKPDHVGWIPTDVNDDSWAVQSLTGSTLRAVSAKVPRNSPCPCGSGLKAKKCCHR